MLSKTSFKFEVHLIQTYFEYPFILDANAVNFHGSPLINCTSGTKVEVWQVSPILHVKVHPSTMLCVNTVV